MKRLILFIWLAGICFQFLYLPWTASTDIPYRMHRNVALSYQWFFAPPQPGESWETVAIDVGRLTISLGAWSAFCGAAFVIFGHYKAKTEQLRACFARARRALSVILVWFGLSAGLAGIAVSLLYLPWKAILPNGKVLPQGYAWFWRAPKETPYHPLPAPVQSATDRAELERLRAKYRAEPSPPPASLMERIQQRRAMQAEAPKRPRLLTVAEFLGTTVWVAAQPDWLKAGLSALAAAFGCCMVALFASLIRPHSVTIRKET